MNIVILINKFIITIYSFFLNIKFNKYNIKINNFFTSIFDIKFFAIILILLFDYDYDYDLSFIIHQELILTFFVLNYHGWLFSETKVVILAKDNNLFIFIQAITKRAFGW